MTELKKEEKDTPAEAAQPAENAESIDSQTDLVEVQTELASALEREGNYKKATLAKEAENKRLKAQLAAINEPVSEEEPEGDKPEEPEKPKEEIPEVVPEPTEDKPQEDVTTGYNPEKEALALFADKYPNVDMAKVRAEYRGGKYETVTEYSKALEDAKDYSDFKEGKRPSTNHVGQGNGVSEVDNKSTAQVTPYDIKQAKKYFKGDIAAYLKYNK